MKKDQELKFVSPNDKKLYLHALVQCERANKKLSEGCYIVTDNKNALEGVFEFSEHQMSFSLKAKASRMVLFGAAVLANPEETDPTKRTYKFKMGTTKKKIDEYFSSLRFVNPENYERL